LLKHVEHDPIEEAERICAGYKDAPPVIFASGRAFYRPSQDVVSVPPLCDYGKPEEYYSTLFHEHVHSTGHNNRLDRSGITELAAFGDESYSKEELVAEIGAAMLCGVVGIDNTTMENSAAYVGSWLRRLKDDKKLIVQAAGQAQKAADYILGVAFDEAG
jgi:antirestriction protein ArdC